MKRRHSATVRRAWPLATAASALVLAAACDDDPASPNLTFPAPTVLTDSVVGRQEALRLLFAGGLLPQTALDPANFVVVNQCNGLRIEGSLRLNGDTLVFTPAQALPYLTNVGVRIQNLLAVNGAQQPAPITLQFTTQPPPVSDASWRLANSPTNDALTAVDFPDATVGFALSAGGALYRTADAGQVYSLVFKSDDITGTAGLHAFGRDSVFFVGGIRTGATFGSALFLSTNGGQTVTAVGSTVTPSLFRAQFVRAPGDPRVRGVVGGQLGGPVAYSYTTAGGGLVQATGLSGDANVALGDVALSRDTIHAIVAEGNVSTQAGVAHYSTDGGRTYSAVSLPANSYQLRGAAFVTATDALVLGDSSTVVRVNTATGAATALGAAQGIPQTTRDAATGSVTTFSYRKARFDDAGGVGYIVGGFRRQRQGQPDVTGGVILTTRDGGATFTRQAISGAPDNGLGFATVLDVRVLSSGQAVLSGINGLLASREPNAPTSVAVCSFTQP